jgi:formate-dependent nitrite reductase membrane component NrfD
VSGGGALVKSALWAVIAGVTLTLGTFWLLQAFGPSEREEAVVEAADYGEWTPSDEPGANDDRAYHLVLRTASGERFETSGHGLRLGVSSGTSLQVEISDVGRELQAIEVHGRQATVGSGWAAVFFAGLVGCSMLVAALAEALESARPILAGPAVVTGLAVGALPVLLLF